MPEMGPSETGNASLISAVTFSATPRLTMPAAFSSGSHRLLMTFSRVFLAPVAYLCPRCDSIFAVSLDKVVVIIGN